MYISEKHLYTKQTLRLLKWRSILAPAKIYLVSFTLTIFNDRFWRFQTDAIYSNIHSPSFNYGSQNTCLPPQLFQLELCIS